MSQTRRMRMFAGPNGSGKTTVKSQLPPGMFGVYVNPDEIEKAIHESGVLNLAPYRIDFTSDELRLAFAASAFLQAHQLADACAIVECRGGVIDFRGLPVNSYYASVLSDLMRRKLLASGASFTFETVMSSPDKIELLRTAQAAGYRTYLYFVATEDPSINVSRVWNRVAEGGHSVPEEKIVARYHRSLELVRDAIRHTNRVYFFDTTESKAWFVAEITDGTRIELKSDVVPMWFKQAVLDRF